jgi:betaine-aldehyde dehydrogenase
MSTSRAGAARHRTRASLHRPSAYGGTRSPTRSSSAFELRAAWSASAARSPTGQDLGRRSAGYGRIEKATREGARLVAGGGRPAGLSRGHFLEPTVLDRVRHGSTATREEVFGPVAAIVRVRDVAEAIALANDSDYGLGANIYTNNLRYVMQAMEEVKAGTFWVNDPLTDNEAGPFGGMRQSGIGRELGEEGLEAFREPKHVHIDYIQERKSYWFPYANRTW